MSNIYGLMADLHLHRWSQFASTDPLTGLNTRLQGLLAEIRRCAREVHEAGGNRVRMAGDVFHVRGSVAPTVLNPTIEALRQIHDTYGTIFEIIPGNHDLEGKESTRMSAAVTALEGGGVVIYDQPKRVDDNTLLMPWCEDIQRLKDALQATVDMNVKKASQTDLVLHAPIDGVIDGLPAHGLDPDYLAGLGFRRVYSGHYHSHKVMAEGKVVSIGALAHHTWSDVNSKAGFLLVDAATGEFTWRASNLPSFVDLTKLVDLEPEEMLSVVDRNYIRIKMTGKVTPALIDNAKKELLDMGALGVIVQAEPAAPVREGTERATVKAGASLEVSVSEFIEGYAPAAANKEAVARAALRILSIAGDVA